MYQHRCDLEELCFENVLIIRSFSSVSTNTTMPTCLSLFSPAAGGPSPQHCFKSPCYYGNPQPGSLGLAAGRCKPECRQNNERETKRERAEGIVDSLPYKPAILFMMLCNRSLSCIHYWSKEIWTEHNILKRITQLTWYRDTSESVRVHIFMWLPGL